MPTNFNPAAQFQQGTPNRGGPGNPGGVYNSDPNASRPDYPTVNTYSGQQPGYGRYVPPTMAGDGSDPRYWNQSTGPYSYNVPNSFGGNYRGAAGPGAFPLLGGPGSGLAGGGGQGGARSPSGPPGSPQGAGSPPPQGGNSSRVTTAPNGSRYVAQPDGSTRFVGRAPAPPPAAGSVVPLASTPSAGSQAGGAGNSLGTTSRGGVRGGTGTGSSGGMGVSGGPRQGSGGSYVGTGGSSNRGSSGTRSNYDNQTGNRTVTVGNTPGAGGNRFLGMAGDVVESGLDTFNQAPRTLFGIPTPFGLVSGAVNRFGGGLVNFFGRNSDGGAGGVPIEVGLQEPDLSSWRSQNPADFQQNPYGDPTDGMISTEEPFVGPPEAGPGQSGGARSGPPRFGGAYQQYLVGPNANAAARREHMITGGYAQGGLLGMSNRAAAWRQSGANFRNATLSNQVR